MGVCLLCSPPRRLDDEDALLTHLREKHDVEIEFQTWPDGAAVDLEEEEAA